MNKTIFEMIEESCQVLQLPFSSKEFAELAEENAMSEDAAKTRRQNCRCAEQPGTTFVFDN